MLFHNKIQVAIERLKIHQPPEGYYLAFSGGKDSCVVKELCNMAEVKYDAHYSVTTIDPPELIYFIKQHHRDVKWDRPEMPFLKMLVHKGAPIRTSRWCCEIYKEGGGAGRYVLICELYDKGRSRLGCVFCPMAKPSMRLKDVECYPNMARAFKQHFQKLYQHRIEQGLLSGIRNWKDGEEMFDWWVSSLSTKAWCKLRGKTYTTKKEFLLNQNS